MKKKEVWALVDDLNKKLKKHKVTITFAPYPKLEIWEVKGEGDERENLLVIRFKTTMWQAKKFIEFIEKIGGKNEG